MSTAKTDLFAFYGLKYILFIGHTGPDRDVVCAEYMFCEAFALDWEDPRIRFVFVQKGSGDGVYSQDGFFHTDEDCYIRFVDDSDFVDEEQEVKRSEVLIIHFDTGKKYEPIDKSISAGKRVFFYDHHQFDKENGDPELSATGLVFLAHSNWLEKNPNYEHLKVMAEFVDAKDYGKNFDGRLHYEMKNLYNMSELLHGLNYFQLRAYGEKTKGNDAKYSKALEAGMNMADAFMSARIMFGRNFAAAKQGRYWEYCGVSLYSNDFAASGINNEKTIRIFLGKGPYLDGKKQVDVIITGHCDRKQIVIYRKDLKSSEYMDVDEIEKRIKAIDPEASVYNDFRDFLVRVESKKVTLENLVEIVESLIEERREKFINLVINDQRETRLRIEEIANMVGDDERIEARDKFLESLAFEKRRFANKMYDNARDNLARLRQMEEEENSSTTLVA